MNRTEVIKLIRMMSVNYRNWPEEGKEQDTVMLWESMFADVPYEVGQAAVKIHISKSPFPPTVADIRDAATKITSPKRIDAIEAWGMIGDAIRRYGFYREKEAMESLPNEVVDMVRRFSWRELCLSDNVETLRAQFRMAWETMQKRREEEQKMPADVRLMLEGSGAIKKLK